ncbi:MAG: leucyl aminopeptidase [Pseudomonadota bacterium]
MAKLPSITFSKNAVPATGTLIVCLAEGADLPDLVAAQPFKAQLERAIKAEKFSGKKSATLVVAGVEGGLDRVILLGCGTPGDLSEPDLLKLGGKLFTAAGKAEKVYVLTDAEKAEHGLSPQQIAMVAAGAKLRAYRFDDYLTKGRENDKKQTKAMRIAFGTPSSAATKKAWEEADGVTDGVLLARQLVNEPANTLGPVEFAKEAQKLKSLGVKVQVLGVPEMKKLGMDALLGVSQGSATERPARMAIMQWDGGKKGEKPLAFIGKGVVFDTGGISLKPGAGMEDMKGDMGGAAAVTGLMHALAARKAKANVVGIIGLVENMPDANAQRPGDIVTSMSGQTIEIINTDAEGRLVLADALWYCQKRFKPKFMINLATLTGAILVALGKEYAGIFSNNDELSENLHSAGAVTDEKVWRLPLHEEYDKMIDTKNADMKNTGGRYAGSITAGQFLQRFVNDVPWVHIDVAGTAMGSPNNEYNQSWGSGYGVRLLNRLVADYYE